MDTLGKAEIALLVEALEELRESEVKGPMPASGERKKKKAD